ncbi:MAG: SEC-C metal-binding domain-containing protein [Pseudomonadota bacterium]
MNQNLNSPSLSEQTEAVEPCCTDETCCPPQTPFIREVPKVGRNEPCPCDSGRKFKKCCGT